MKNKNWNVEVQEELSQKQSFLSFVGVGIYNLVKKNKNKYYFLMRDCLNFNLKKKCNTFSYLKLGKKQVFFLC